MHPCPRYSLISRYHIPARINENIAFLIEFALPPPRGVPRSGNGRRGKGGWRRVESRDFNSEICAGCSRRIKNSLMFFNNNFPPMDPILDWFTNFFIISRNFETRKWDTNRFFELSENDSNVFFRDRSIDRSIGRNANRCIRCEYVYFCFFFPSLSFFFFFSSCERIDLKAQRKSRVHPWGPGR